MATHVVLSSMQGQATTTSSPGQEMRFELATAGEDGQGWLIKHPEEDVELTLIAEGAPFAPPEHAIALISYRDGDCYMSPVTDQCMLEHSKGGTSKLTPLLKSISSKQFIYFIRSTDIVHFNKHTFTCRLREEPVTVAPSSQLGSLRILKIDPRDQPQIFSTALEKTNDDQHMTQSPKSRVPLKQQTSIQEVLETPVKRKSKQTYHKTPRLQKLEAVDKENRPELSAPDEVSTEDELDGDLPTQQISALPLDNDTPFKAKLVPPSTNDTPGKLKRVRKGPTELAAQPVETEMQKKRSRAHIEEIATAEPESRAKRSRKAIKQEALDDSEPKAKRSRKTAKEASPEPERKAKRSRKTTKEGAGPGPEPAHDAKHQAGSVTTSQTDETLRHIVMTGNNYKADKKMADWLKGRGCLVLEDVPDGSYTCVIKDAPIKPTVKLLRALTRQASIVTDEWLKASRDQNQLLPQAEFVHAELKGMVPESHRHTLLEGKELFVTTTLQSVLQSSGMNGWKEFESLLVDLGAETIHSGSMRTFKDQDWSKVLVLGEGSSDAQARQIAEETQVFSKDLIKESVMQGRLLTAEPSFQIAPRSSAPAVKGRKR